MIAFAPDPVAPYSVEREWVLVMTLTFVQDFLVLHLAGLEQGGLTSYCQQPQSNEFCKGLLTILMIRDLN
jgi:hypothetical protein